MFTTLAKSGLARFRLAQPRHVVPQGFGATHANDNLRGHRRRAGERRSLPPRLACHWVLIDGRPECRWQIEDLGKSIEEPDGHRGTRNPPGLPLALVGRRALAA